jgi:hypothetical protein
VPQGHNGKHKLIVTMILKDLPNWKSGSGLKVPLADLAESKEPAPSVGNRALRKQHGKIATATGAVDLYVWNTSDYGGNRRRWFFGR